VGEALARGIVVGAICNAVSFMAAHGFLNGIRHTGNTLGMLQKWGGANYTGEALYEERQAARDGHGVIIAVKRYLRPPDVFKRYAEIEKVRLRPVATLHCIAKLVQRPGKMPVPFCFA